MCSAQLFRRLAVTVLVALPFCALVNGQSPVDPGKLPARTLFYMRWRGMAAGDARKNNSIFALWDDPQFATARASLIDGMMSDSRKSKDKPTLSREEFERYATLLDNPFVMGYLRRPESRPAPKSSPEKSAPGWNGIFFVYDRSGKEELLSKAVLQMRGAEKEIPKLSELTVSGIPALKVERKEVVTYWAEFGKYAVSANELPVFEEILNVVNGKNAEDTLSKSPAYQEAKPLLNGGILEFFLAIPTAAQIVQSSPTSSSAQLGILLRGLKLDSVHSVAGQVSLEGARTRLDGAVLGDTAPGGLFDIWADGQSNPQVFGYVTSQTIYFGETQLNLLGIYNTLKKAFSSPAASQKQAVSPFEQMAEARLGMPVPDALRLVTGEIAWLQTSPILDDQQKVYLIGIRNKPDALKLTRTLMSDQITSERAEGDTTYLKISRRGGQSSAGVAQWNFYHLAMTPTALFASSKTETLREYVLQNPATTGPSPLQAARAQFPDKLNGFSYLDFQKLDWHGLQKKWVEEVNKAAETAKSTDAATSSRKFSDWLSQADPEVFSRHLHTMAGASWKDAKGVHFEQWLE